MQTNRRPIAARAWPWTSAVADCLARIGVTSDQVSIAGLVFGLGAGAAFAATATCNVWFLWLGGAALVQLRLAANMFDGMVAERGGGSRLGELFNELPDCLTDIAGLVGLGYAAGGAATLGWIAALAAVLTAYVRAVGRGVTGHQDFGGPFAKQQRMALVTAVALVYATAPIWAGAPLAGNGPGLAAVALAIIAVGSLLTCLLRLARIARALRG